LALILPARNPLRAVLILRQESLVESREASTHSVAVMLTAGLRNKKIELGVNLLKN
jgi:hypothetical protein